MQWYGILVKKQNEKFLTPLGVKGLYELYEGPLFFIVLLSCKYYILAASVIIGIKRHY